MSILEKIISVLSPRGIDDAVQTEIPNMPDKAINDLEEDEAVEEECLQEKLGYAEGQTFGIEYVNAKGEESTRTITVNDISMGRGSLILKSRCHKSKRPKNFRVDRISTIYDILDGELYETEDFLKENFGIDTEFIKLSLQGKLDLPKNQSDQKIAKIMSEIKAPMILLGSLAYADDHLDESEIDVAVRYLVHSYEGKFDIVSSNNIKKVTDNFKRIRPSKKSVLDSLEVIYNYLPKEKHRFINALTQLMGADGKVDEREIEFINLCTNELMGVDFPNDAYRYRLNHSEELIEYC